MTDIIEQPVAVRGTPRTKAPEPALSTNAIRGERYWTPEFARQEEEALWPRVWQVAGRVDQIREPGDYVTYEIGRDSVIAVRGLDDVVRVFYNVCQHRGNRLVTAEVGTLLSGEFQCAYHGWRFGVDGRLNWVPDEDDFVDGSPCGVRNLVEVPSDTWAGFIWFNMDPDAAPLREWLDPVAEHLDAYRMEDMRRTHWVTVVGDFNWKCVQDNFNESYHLPFVHPQTLAAMNEHHSGSQFDLYESSHARMLMPGGGPGPHYAGKPERTLKSLGPDLEFWDLDPSPYVDDLSGLREALQQRKRELGDSKGYDFSQVLGRAVDRQLPLHGVPQHLVQHEARWLHLAPGHAVPGRPAEVLLRHVVPHAVPRGVERVLVELDGRLGVDRPPGRAPDRHRRRGVVRTWHRPGRRDLEDPTAGSAIARLPRRVHAMAGATGQVLPRQHRPPPGDGPGRCLTQPGPTRSNWAI